MHFPRPAVLLAATLLCGLPTLAWAETPATTDLNAKVETLEARVAAQQAQIADLQAKGDQNWLNEQRTEEIQGLIRDALADADTRASLAADGTVAGNDGSFFIKTADDNFRLNIGGQIQTRYIADLRASNHLSALNGSDDGHEDGFQMRRIKVCFGGYVSEPRIDFKITLAADRDQETMMAEEAWLAHRFGDSGVTVWGGRFQDWFGREQAGSSKYLQAVEKSIPDIVFSAADAFIEGIGVEWKAIPEYLWFHWTVSDGFNSGTDPVVAAGSIGGSAGHDYYNGDADFATTGRIDLKIVGDWSKANAPAPAPRQLADAESWSTEQGLQAFVGFGAHYEQAKSGDGQAAGRFTVTPNTATGLGTAKAVTYDEFFEWTADTLIKYRGFGFMGAFYGLHFRDTAVAGTPENLNNYGATAQAGYMVIPDKLEPFVRYEWICPDGNLNTNQLNTVTAGFNWFLKQHNAKFTLDSVLLLNNLNNVTVLNTSLKGAGLLCDDGARKGQIVIRAQFQLLF
jgi:hypothetical protein